MATETGSQLGGFRCVLVAALVVLPLTASAAPPPCSGVDRSLSAERRAALAPAVAKQLHIAKADVLASLRFEGWTILLVETFQSDEMYLFYAHEPTKSHYITDFSGAVRIDEEPTMVDWAEKNAHGIPGRLAKCFGSVVTPQ